MPRIITYNPKLKQLARKLRSDSTYGEVMLWLRLKKGKILGYDFHRQRPIENYIIDFFCPALMLAIEIDGCSHELEDIANKDEKRQEELEKIGITFLRFSEYDARYNTDEVIEAVRSWIEDKMTKHTSSRSLPAQLLVRRKNDDEHTPSSGCDRNPPLSRGENDDGKFKI